MTQEISSLMDGELDGPEAGRAIRSCCTSGEAAQTWHAYHVIGEVLRGNAPAATSTSRKVMERLAAEPTVLAPRRPAFEKVVRIALAAAASVATVAVVGWIGIQGGTPASVPLVAKNPAPAMQTVQPVATTVTVTPPPALDVQDYLAAHRQIPSPEAYRPVANRAAPAR